MADVDFTKLVAAINKLERTMSSRSNSGTTGTTGTTDENYEKVTEEINKQKAAIAELNQKDKALLDTKQNLIKAQVAQAAAIRERIRLLKEEGEDSADALALEQGRLAKLEESTAALEGVAESQGRFNELLDASLGLGRKSVISLLAQEGGFEGLAEALKEKITLQNLANSVVSKAIEGSIAYAYALSSSRAELARNSGASQELIDSMGDLASGNLAAGVGFQEMSEGMTAVRQNIAGVSIASTEAQNDIAFLAAENISLGISAETASQNLGYFMTNLGMTADQAGAANNELVRFALATGQSAAAVSEEFQQALPQLAAFGESAVDQFEGLSVAARAAGVSVSSLISIAEGLDTFDAATNAVAGLNAVLGTNLNAVDLLNASYEDKILMIQESIAQTGIEFSQLGRHEQRHIANSIGITDLSEAQRMFAGSTAEVSARLQQQAEDEEDLAAARERSQDIGQKLAKVAEALAVAMQPIAFVIGGLASGFLALNELMGGTLGIVLTVGSTMLLFTGKLGLLAKAVGILGTAFKALGAAIGLGGAGGAAGAAGGAGLFTRMAMGLSTLGTAALASAKGLLVLGLTFLAIGVGIGLAAMGLSMFVEAFRGMEPGQILSISGALLVFLGSMTALALGLALLSPKLLLASAGLKMFGLAMLSVGAAIVLAGFGFSLIASSLSELIASGGVEGLAQIAAMSGELMLAASAISVLSASIFALSVAMLLLPERKLISFGYAMDSLGETVTAIGAQPEAIDKIESVMDKASELADKQRDLGASVLENTANQILDIFSSAFGAGGEGGKEIVMTLNDREFGRAVAKVIEDQTDIRVR